MTNKSNTSFLLDYVLYINIFAIVYILYAKQEKRLKLFAYQNFIIKI